MYPSWPRAPQGRSFSSNFIFLVPSIVCGMWYVNVCVLSCFSHVQLYVTLWTAAYQMSLSMGFSRQEHQSGLPFSLSFGNVYNNSAQLMRYLVNQLLQVDRHALEDCQRHCREDSCIIWEANSRWPIRIHLIHPSIHSPNILQANHPCMHSSNHLMINSDPCSINLAYTALILHGSEVDHQIVGRVQAWMICLEDDG